MLQEATAQSFAHEVLESPVPVLVDFWADWCGPCKAMTSVLESLAAKYEGKVKVVKVNVVVEAALAAQYQVRGLPTFLLFEHGNIKGSRMGASSQAELEALLA